MQSWTDTNFQESEEMEVISFDTRKVPPPTWNFSKYETVLFMRRHSAFYLWNLVTPLFCLVVLTCVQFIIPLDSGERISYAVTVTLALTVFQMFFVDQLPETSLTTPVVSKCILFQNTK